jgi:Family of unknown function (DUF5652)
VNAANASLSPQLIVIIFVVYLWTLLWKGLALWRAVKLDQKNWFIALILLSIFNLLGIIEIAYLFFFAKKRMKLQELKFWETK